MATAQETIVTGLQALRVLGLGESLSAVRGEYCLKHLNAFVVELAGFGGSLPFVSESVSGSYQVGTKWPAVRLLCLDGATVTLPQANSSFRAPADGARVHVIDAAETADTSNITIARNGWLIDGSASDYTISIEGGSVMLMFRADLGDWKPIGTLALATSLPFPSDFDIPVALNAALRYSLFGQSLLPHDEKRAKDGMTRFRARYAKPPPSQFDPAVSAIGGRRGVQGTLNDFLNGIEN